MSRVNIETAEVYNNVIKFSSPLAEVENSKHNISLLGTFGDMVGMIKILSLKMYTADVVQNWHIVSSFTKIRNDAIV